MGALPLVLAPVSTLCFYVTLAHYGGSLAAFTQACLTNGMGPVLWQHRPRFEGIAMFVYLGWLAVQALLYRVLPGAFKTGQLTPAGHLLSYRMNGLAAFVVTHVGIFALCWAGLFDPSFIPRHWSGLFFAVNICGLLATTFGYVKALWWPTHLTDRRFSGCFLYDLYMGIELNPRFGNEFDFKLFTNGRVGMMSWLIIDLSNLAYQRQEYGHMSPSLVLMSILQAIYVVDFFINEAWYLRTIDVAHDHYGFYLAWGCFAFLPTTYTLQAQYLGLYPTAPPTWYLAGVFAIGLSGYAIFRSVNDQKDQVRRAGAEDQPCRIWGRPATYIRATYETLDGARHTSLLLTCGWWGLARHANYVGDLLLSSAMCALVGRSVLLVWFYATFMGILLVHRCLRDEARGQAKYGKYWNEYCGQVPWRFVPGIW